MECFPLSPLRYLLLSSSHHGNVLSSLQHRTWKDQVLLILMKKLDKSKASSNKRAAFFQTFRKYTNNPAPSCPEPQPGSLPGWPSMLVNLMSELMVGYNSIHEDIECNWPCSCSSSRNSYKPEVEWKFIVTHHTFTWRSAGMDTLNNWNSIFVKIQLKNHLFHHHFFLLSPTIYNVPIAFPFHSNPFPPTFPYSCSLLANSCIAPQTNATNADNGHIRRAH